MFSDAVEPEYPPQPNQLGAEKFPLRRRISSDGTYRTAILQKDPENMASVAGIIAENR